MLEKLVQEPKIGQEPAKVPDRISQVLALIDEQKEWKAAYQRNEGNPTYAQSSQKETHYIFVPKEESAQTYKLFFGNEAMTVKTESTYEPQKQETAREERKGAVDNMEGAKVFERTRFAKFFATLNELSVEDKEILAQFRLGPNKVVRHLNDGSYSRLKGYNAASLN